MPAAVSTVWPPLPPQQRSAFCLYRRQNILANCLIRITGLIAPHHWLPPHKNKAEGQQQRVAGSGAVPIDGKRIR